MARIAIYDPSDANVANRVTTYLLSANTPDFDGEPNKVVNPDVSALSAVAQKYWKYDSGGPPYIVEMSAGEKATIDALAPVLDIQLVAQQPQEPLYEICDRDIKLITCKFDPKADLTVSGADANGDITYTSNRRAAYGNDITVEHITGATGGGNESRALAVTTSLKDITVTFGTDGSGNSITPTANALKTAVDGFAAAAALVSVAVGGTGASANALQASASLTGGVTNSFEDLKIDPTTMKELPWHEAKAVGVFKDVSGTMVQCTDQSDATTNGILSVWEYTAIDQADCFTPIDWDLKGGSLYIDGAVTATDFDHRMYVMAAPDLGPDYFVRFFDGYLGPYSGGWIHSNSPTAKLLSPTLSSVASVMRIYFVHPAGDTKNHVIRFLTYRPPGTF